VSRGKNDREAIMGTGDEFNQQGALGRRSGAPFESAFGPLGQWETTQFVTEIMAIIGTGKGACMGVRGVLGGGL